MGIPVKLENTVFIFRVVKKDVMSKNGINKRINVSRVISTLEIFKPTKVKKINTKLIKTVVRILTASVVYPMCAVCQIKTEAKIVAKK